MTPKPRRCFACNGRELPFHTVQSPPFEAYCDNCAERCPACWGDGRDCGMCEGCSGVLLTHYGRSELDRNRASEEQNFIGMVKDTIEER